MCKTWSGMLWNTRNWYVCFWANVCPQQWAGSEWCLHLFYGALELPCGSESWLVTMSLSKCQGDGEHCIKITNLLVWKVGSETQSFLRTEQWEQDHFCHQFTLKGYLTSALFKVVPGPGEDAFRQFFLYDDFVAFYFTLPL